MPMSRGVTDEEPPALRSPGAWLRPVGVLVVIALVLVWLVGREGSHSTLLPPTSSSGVTEPADAAGERDSLAVDALQRQGAALNARSETGYLAAWDASTTAGQRRAQTTYANLRALDIDALEARYIAADTEPSRGAEQRLGGEAWTADVEVGYTVGGLSRRPAQIVVSYTFVVRQNRAFIVDVRAADGQRQPIWTLGRLDVRRSARTLVAATSEAAARRVSAHLEQAVTDVEAVLPGWRGTLVAYVPGSSTALESLLAAAPGSYDGVAAVTTTVDGSTRAGAPVAIVVNAAVFDGLGPLGAHVVITHEATHAATNAAVVDMPLWVAEGFADYVGVGAADVPFSVSARAVLREIRATGVPARLPRSPDFSAGRRGLEVSYEEAWLANRLLAQTYGERRLVRFYTAVVRDPDQVDAAFRDLGTTPEAFAQHWRDYLSRLVR